jgi:hypothetical protein
MLVPPGPLRYAETPHRRIAELTPRCILVRSVDIVRIIKNK